MKSVLELRGTWPVAQRELREAARRKGNRRLRFWSALAGTAFLGYLLATSDDPVEEIGFQLFLNLHAMLFGLILVVVPCLTADCIAREKRDGTLGLLFLTPLTPGGVVAGKMLSQTLRVFTLWLAVVPVFTVPFVVGGITWQNTLNVFSAEFSAAVLCLAAGLLASSLARNRGVAFVLAFFLAAVFVYLFTESVFITLMMFNQGLSFFQLLETLQDDLWAVLSLDLGMLAPRPSSGPPLSMQTMSMVPGYVPPAFWWLICLGCPLSALLVLALVFRFAARHLQRSWQDKVPSPKRERLLQRYCTPVLRHSYRRVMRRSLDRNPVAWLQQYSWKARLIKWGLCLAFILIQMTFLAGGSVEGLLLAENFMLVGLAAAWLFVGVNSFLEDKRSGALELLLVSPISVNKLIFGRVWGLWKQFLPALLVLELPAVWPRLLISSWPYDTPLICSPVVQLLIWCNFLTLPVFATCAALRVKNLLLAAAWTLGRSLPILICALIVAGMIGWFPDNILAVFPALLSVVLCYAAFALQACHSLNRSLSQRIYSF